MTIRNLWTGCVGPNLSKESTTNGWFRYYCQLASSYSFKSMVAGVFWLLLLSSLADSQ